MSAKDTSCSRCANDSRNGGVCTEASPLTECLDGSGSGWVEMRAPAAAQEPAGGANGRQVGGSHYKGCAIEPWDYVHANGLGFFEGNAIRYLSRWKQKNGIEDLKKARHYIDKLIELEGGK